MPHMFKVRTYAKNGIKTLNIDRVDVITPKPLYE